METSETAMARKYSTTAPRAPTERVQPTAGTATSETETETETESETETETAPRRQEAPAAGAQLLTTAFGR